MREIGNLRRIYGKYTVVHKNIRTLNLILCVSLAIVGGNKMQMRETHAQCVKVGRSAIEYCTLQYVHQHGRAIEQMCIKIMSHETTLYLKC